MGSTRPVRRSNRPAGIPRTHRPSGRSPKAALHELALPFRVRSPGPRAVPPVTRHGRRRFLSWTFPALRHSRRLADPLARGGSLTPQRAAYGVWLPPSRTSPPALPTLARWSVHGLHPSRSSPRRDRCPSRGPCPPDVTRRARAPRGGTSTTWPPSGPCSRDEFVLTPEPEGSGRRSLPGVRPSRACSCSAWRSLSSRRLPSRPQAALRLGPPGSQGIAAWTSGAIRLRTADSHRVLYLPTYRRSVRRRKRRAYGFASRAGRQGNPTRSKPLANDATADPGPAARHRRPSVYAR
jgi:hypothetical protein